jgi:GTP-binding protein
MKIRRAEFIKSTTRLSGAPLSDQPEFAFIGRSNVGKSSLINALTHKKGLARVSKTPGRTREINFFSIDERWLLVDLPGYGFARVSKAMKEQFNEFVSEYLLNRANLTGVFVLLDARHPPQKLDLQFVSWLVECSLPFALIFTKIDKVKPRQLRKNRESFLAELAELAEGTPITFEASSVTGEGRNEILQFIERAIDASR